MDTRDTATFFQELDVQDTPLGELVLRRRKPICLPDTWVHEVTLAGRFLMSNLVHDSEDALADLALRRLTGSGWRVLVGGLGLGHTAAAALAWKEVAQVEVAELLPAVIAWHRRGLVPLAEELTSSERCRIVEADAFALVRDSAPASWDAVLIDIDDSPEHLLDPAHEAFYAEDGLRSAQRALAPNGVLAIWTAGEEVPEFTEHLGRVFDRVEVEVVCFDNPLFMREERNAIYLARG